MERHVVLGTAGHIDHGKTALVRALTGVDTDRLAEEKARGITIDLGFAALALDGVTASVVDVPGHEGFIRNMVAGATGVDLALLVVAADEGVMPQTREHVAILRLLGVTRGVVALTKADLAPDADWRALVADDVRGLLGDLGAWPIVAVSATTGTGLDDLRAALAREAAAVPERAAADAFRLPVDRVFARAGAGTVVTGTTWSGTVGEGARVRILPQDREARVRSVQVHGQAAAAAVPGRRTALALVGVGLEDVERGAVVVDGDGWRTSVAFDARVTMVEPPPLRPRQRVRIHHGTAEVMGRVVVVGEEDADAFPVRIRLEAPLVLRAGDRFVIRSYSPMTTIAGGIVAEPWADAVPRLRGRRRGPAPWEPVGAARLAAHVRRRGARGMSATDAGIASGVTAAEREALLADPEAWGLAELGGWLVASDAVVEAAERMLAAIGAFHSAQPLEAGMSVQAWRAAAGGPAGLADLAERRLLSDRTVVRAGGLVRLPGFDPGNSTESRAGQRRVLERLEAAASEPPTTADLQGALPDLDVPALLRLLHRAGLVEPVGPDRYYAAEALQGERHRLEAALSDLGAATPAQLRERLGLSRKWLIPLLEWADREGVTVREGDRRRLKLQEGA